MANNDKTILLSAGSCWTRIGVWGTQTPRCEKLETVIHCRNCNVFTSAGRGLLERSPPPEYVDEWTAMLTKSGQTGSRATKSLLVVRLGDELVAIPIALVKEIVEMGKTHKLPHRSNTVIRGLVSIRGELKICVSVGNLLGIRKCEMQYDTQRHVAYSERLVVVSRDGKEFVFPVSEVMGIRRIDPGSMHDAPSTIANAITPYIAGIYRIDDRNIGMIDEENLFAGLNNNLT